MIGHPGEEFDLGSERRRGIFDSRSWTGQSDQEYFSLVPVDF